MRRLVVVGLVAAAGEWYFAVRYAAFGALFHYWLHGLLGVAAGLIAVVAVRTARPGRPHHVDVVSAALLGRLFFAAPDVIFLALDTPHAGWMDVFGAHISVHFVPAPVPFAYAVFVLAVVAAAAVTAGLRRAGAVLAAVAVALFVGGLAVRAPLPRTLDEVREAPGIAWVCPLPGG